MAISGAASAAGDAAGNAADKAGGSSFGWIGAVIGGITGGIQLGVSMDQLSKLPDAKQYSAGSDLETATSLARRVAQKGMTPAERAAAEQNIGTTQSRTQRAMEQRGLGNLAAAVSQIRTTDAMNQLSVQNAQIKRQGLGQYAQLAGQMQSIENQNIQSFNKMLYAQQQALGQSAQAGFSNLTMGLGEGIAMAVEGEDKFKRQSLGGDPVTPGELGVTDSTPVSTPNIPFNRVADPADGSYFESELLGTQTSDPFNPISNIGYQPTDTLGGQQASKPFGGATLNYQGVNPIKSQYQPFDYNTTFGNPLGITPGFTDDFGTVTG